VIWLSWRQQRGETLLTALALALVGALAVPPALHHHDSLYGNLRWLNLLIPLIGVALAAPFILDLENGTTAFAWTQSVTRRRWLATRLGIAVVTALVAAGAYSLLVEWYRRPLDAINGPFSDSSFDSRGIVPLAYALLAFGLALALGVVWRRIAPAMIIAFSGVFAARLFFESWLRARLLTPVTATWAGSHEPSNYRGAWMLTNRASNRAGRIYPEGPPIVHTCGRSGCFWHEKASYTHAIYHPASRFWEFQGIEFALVGGLAALFIAFAAWRVLRAD
jgi:hypothetical protein